MDVVWDYGVWTKAERNLIRERAEKSGFDYRFHKMVCDWTTAMERVVQRTHGRSASGLKIDNSSMQHFRSLYEEVSDSEGFEIIEVDANEQPRG